MKRWKHWAWAGVGAAACGAVAVIIDPTVTCGWGGRVHWSCMGWSNLRTFREQFVQDLPIGTPRSTVESYLAREGIPFIYGDSSPALEERGMYLDKRLIAGWGNPFDGAAYWYISFDRDDHLARVKTWQEYK